MTSLKMEVGSLGVKNTAPVNMMGAVSPAARLMPRMAPVRIPGKGRRQDHPPDGLPFGGPQTQRSLAVGIGHGLEGLLGGTDDHRQGHGPQGQGAGGDADAHVEMTTKKARPNRPKTTEGTPARLLMPSRISAPPFPDGRIRSGRWPKRCRWAGPRRWHRSSDRRCPRCRAGSPPWSWTPWAAG
jgi:hypothetical protein